MNPRLFEVTSEKRATTFRVVAFSIDEIEGALGLATGDRIQSLKDLGEVSISQHVIEEKYRVIAERRSEYGRS